ncbi:helix-turn-helix domain-containing protein [Teichococcus deserti]|uniref:helix-turn-helix domain-containing protein n=1 Tax=Teichococcus deserti TaxID=1817963 RepID=UPI001054B9F4|nr:helix-turn-helix transcriptional regulator [Pseudoroseomonas deserti]
MNRRNRMAQQGCQGNQGEPAGLLEFAKGHTVIYALSRNPRKVEFYREVLPPSFYRNDNPGMNLPESALSPESQAMQANLKTWRKHRNLTLAALAEHTGNKLSTLSSWENGKRAMSLDDLQKLATFYGVHPAALLMAPQNAAPVVARMQTAASIAAGLDDEAAEAWLTMGRRASDRPRES